MWERFGRRRRTRRSEAVGQAMLALGNVRRRLGPSTTGRAREANGKAVVGVGIGGLAIAMMVVLAFLLLRRRRAGETASGIPDPEEGLEAVPLEEEEEVMVAPPGVPSAEDVSPREEPPPGEERPERRGATSTTPPTPQEEPPPGEERPERR
jgi:hypothetical protein